MQVLKVIRYDLSKAVKDDWKAFVCRLRTGHTWKRVGTTHSPCKGNLDGTWTIGPVYCTHYGCENCTATKRIYARKGDGLRDWLRRHVPFHYRKLDGRSS